MAIDPISVASPSPSPTKTSGISADFDTFLKMLTAQIKNQDPMNPVDSGDYANQLATFAGVEQQVLTNDLLKRIELSTSGSDLMAVSQWVGKSVNAPTDLYFDGTSAQISFDLPTNATSGDVIIASPSGKIIASLPVTAGENQVNWDGYNDAGHAVAYGNYRISVQPYEYDTPLNPEPAYCFQTVTEVRIENGQPKLVLSGGTSIDPATVSALRL